MHDRLPPEQDAVRRAIVERHIVREAPLEVQAAGCVAIVAAFSRVLGPLVGGIAVHAIVTRALRLAQQRNPILASVADAGTLMHADTLLASLQGTERGQAHEALVMVIDMLFTVLHGLLGSIAGSILPDVEAELVAEDAQSERDEERQ